MRGRELAAGLGDLNGDGHQDLMWYDSTTGEVSSWLLNGYGNVVTKQSLQWVCSYRSTCEPLGHRQPGPRGPRPAARLPALSRHLSGRGRSVSGAGRASLLARRPE
ncbi:FG-GAP repeat protein [Amycolatopsis sp. NPDC048633]|uniref:FG-GAP repeat protein n=1 Tax=Amycolatopsis sp. NPDC048633 TaxID=3157095 RepID=UPI0033E11F12